MATRTRTTQESIVETPSPSAHHILAPGSRRLVRNTPAQAAAHESSPLRTPASLFPTSGGQRLGGIPSPRPLPASMYTSIPSSMQGQMQRTFSHQYVTPASPSPLRPRRNLGQELREAQRSRELQQGHPLTPLSNRPTATQQLMAEFVETERAHSPMHLLHQGRRNLPDIVSQPHSPHTPPRVQTTMSEPIRPSSRSFSIASRRSIHTPSTPSVFYEATPYMIRLPSSRTSSNNQLD
jgi:hypothetical protein